MVDVNRSVHGLAGSPAEFWAGLKLGQATGWLDDPDEIACACIGPPACCRYGLAQARNLRRAAHIVVKLLDEVASSDRGHGDDQRGGGDGRP